MYLHDCNGNGVIMAEQADSFGSKIAKVYAIAYNYAVWLFSHILKLKNK